MENEWLLLFNPFCLGKTGAKKVLPKLEQQLHQMRIQFRTVKTTAPGDARIIAENYIRNRGCRKIIAAGGDGTLHEIVNGIFDCSDLIKSTDVALACVPLGTGNDWSRTVDIPHDLIAAIRTIKLGTYFYQDVGVLNYYDKSGEEKSTHFVNVAGLGFDAEVVKSVQKQKRKGKSSINYSWHLLKKLPGYKAPNVHVYVDGQEVFEGALFSMAAGIGRYNGNGMMPLPDAIPDDGLIDVSIVEKISPLKVLSKKSELYDGTYVLNPFVHAFRGTNVVVESDNNLRLEADGELLGIGPVKITQKHHALKILSTLKNKIE
jgi:YegS/Rv2252/BmrU family lipid kinase